MDRQPLSLSQVAFAVFLALASAQAKDPLAEGDVLFEKKEHARALEVFIAADRQKPGDPEILRRIARQYDQLAVATTEAAEEERLVGLSVTYAEQAVKAGPRNSNAHLALAIVYGRAAQFSPARRKVELSRLIKEEAEIAARLDPRSDYAWHILGRWNYELASFNPVLKALAQAIYGEFPDASYAKAAEHLQKAVAIAPQRVLHQIELGRTWLALGEKEKARQALEKGLALPTLSKDDEEAKQRGRDALKQL